MDFSTGRCKIMHFGNENIDFEHEIFGKPLFEIQEEIEIEVIISNEWKYAKQCIVAYVSIIARNINHETRHNSYPLQYHNQFWLLNLIKDVEKLKLI